MRMPRFFEAKQPSRGRPLWSQSAYKKRLGELVSQTGLPRDALRNLLLEAGQNESEIRRLLEREKARGTEVHELPDGPIRAALVDPQQQRSRPVGASVGASTGEAILGDSVIARVKGLGEATFLFFMGLIVIAFPLLYVLLGMDWGRVTEWMGLMHSPIYRELELWTEALANVAGDARSTLGLPETGVGASPLLWVCVLLAIIGGLAIEISSRKRLSRAVAEYVEHADGRRGQ